MSQVAWTGKPHYPASDGAPMGETARHQWSVVDLIVALEDRFADRPDVYVGGDQFLYFVEGDPYQVICPDAYVVLGRPKRPLRDTWKVWEEDDRVPDLIVEITSKSTRKTDLGAKFGLYAQLGVPEYVMFDPLGEYLTPRLQLWRLEGGRYEQVERGTAGVWSEVLQAWLEPHGIRIRLREADGTLVPTVQRRAADATRRAEDEARRADEAERRADLQTQRAAAAERALLESEAEREALLARLRALEEG